MKLEQLEQIKKKTLAECNIDDGRESGIRVAVGMATCGIAAGAKAVMDTIREEIGNRGITGVSLVKTGCIGVCRLEPIVEVYVPGRERITYVEMDALKAAAVVSEHIVNGNPVLKYTVGAAD